MQNVNYLDGFIYHMVHVSNIRSIFLRKALLSQEMLKREKIEPFSIAEPSVQKLRDRIFVWDSYEQRYRNLHCYVPFYLGTHSSMLYRQRKEGRLSELVIFKVLRAVLGTQGALFTDGNATIQRLSQNGNERVGIIPARTHIDECIRTYRPDGPHGTSQLISNFFCDVKLLNRLDWDVINYFRRIEPWEESMRVRSAETLIPDSLAITEIRGIAAGTREMEKTVNTIMDECGVTGMLPQAVYEPTLFNV